MTPIQRQPMISFLSERVHIYFQYCSLHIVKKQKQPGGRSPMQAGFNSSCIKQVAWRSLQVAGSEQLARVRNSGSRQMAILIFLLYPLLLLAAAMESVDKFCRERSKCVHKIQCNFFWRLSFQIQEDADREGEEENPFKTEELGLQQSGKWSLL